MAIKSMISSMSRPDTLLKFARNVVLTNRAVIIYRDVRNLVRYGSASPKFAERIWVNPRSCLQTLNDGVIMSLMGSTGRIASGSVTEAPWPLERAVPIMDVPKIGFCIDHWVNGIEWRHTGAYEYIEKDIARYGRWDGCRTRDDIIQRYKRLDLIFEQVKKEGRLKTREEIVPGNFRESGGVIVHIGPEGEPFFGRDGIHRFAIAYILDLPLPAQIGIVHKSGIPFLAKLRQPQELPTQD